MIYTIGNVDLGCTGLESFLNLYGSAIGEGNLQICLSHSFSDIKCEGWISVFHSNSLSFYYAHFMFISYQCLVEHVLSLFFFFSFFLFFCFVLFSNIVGKTEIIDLLRYRMRHCFFFFLCNFIEEDYLGLV